MIGRVERLEVTVSCFLFKLLEASLMVILLWFSFLFLFLNCPVFQSFNMFHM